MEIGFNGYVGLPDLTQVSNLEGLKNLYFPSSLTTGDTLASIFLLLCFLWKKGV